MRLTTTEPEYIHIILCIITDVRDWHQHDINTMIGIYNTQKVKPSSLPPYNLVTVAWAVSLLTINNTLSSLRF